MPAVLVPAFSPDVSTYTAGYFDEEIEDYDGELTVTAVPADGVTVQIVRQALDGEVFTGGTPVENGGSFPAAGTDRLVITCEKDGQTGTYYVLVMLFPPEPHPKS